MLTTKNQNGHIVTIERRINDDPIFILVTVEHSTECGCGGAK